MGRKVEHIIKYGPEAEDVVLGEGLREVTVPGKKLTDTEEAFKAIENISSDEERKEMRATVEREEREARERGAPPYGRTHHEVPRHKTKYGMGKEHRPWMEKAA